MNNIPFHSYPFHDEDANRQLPSQFPGQPGFPFSPGLPPSSSIPGFPPVGPGFPFGQQPGFPGGQQPGGGEAPTSPPPSFTPQMQQGVGLYAVDPGSMRRCLYRFTYVWLHNGRSFWFYPTYVGRTSVAGYRWRRNRWVYYGTDADRIVSFQCF